jgi:hypothetical protein
MSSTRSQRLAGTAPPRPVADPNHPAGRPTAAGVGRGRASVPSAPGLSAAAVAVTLVSLAGSLLAVATGLSASWWEAVGPTARLSVPLPMNLALILLALGAASARRRLALACATLLALACGAAVVSGFFDGGYAAALTPVERLAQVALVLGLAGLSVLAGRRVVRVLRG